MSGTSRRRRLGLGLALGLGAPAVLGLSGCRQLHQRQVFYPNGDGRRLVDVRTDRGVRAREPIVEADPRDRERVKDLPPMLLGR